MGEVANRTEGAMCVAPTRFTRVGDDDRWKNEGVWEENEAEEEAKAEMTAPDEDDDKNPPDGVMDRWKALDTGRTEPLERLLEDVVAIMVSRERRLEK